MTPNDKPGKRLPVDKHNSLSEHELALALGMSRSTVRDWRYKDKGPKWKRQGLKEILYRVSDILEWCEAHNVEIVNPFLEEPPRCPSTD